MWHLLVGLYLSSCTTSRQMEMGIKIKLKQEAVTVVTTKLFWT